MGYWPAQTLSLGTEFRARFICKDGLCRAILPIEGVLSKGRYEQVFGPDPRSLGWHIRAKHLLSAFTLRRIARLFRSRTPIPIR